MLARVAGVAEKIAHTFNGVDPTINWVVCCLLCTAALALSMLMLVIHVFNIPVGAWAFLALAWGVRPPVFRSRQRESVAKSNKGTKSAGIADKVRNFLSHVPDEPCMVNRYISSLQVKMHADYDGRVDGNAQGVP